MDNIRFEGEKLKDISEKGTKKEEDKLREQKEQRKSEANLAPKEYGRVMKEANRSFGIPGVLTADIDGYVHQVNPHIRVLIKDQLKKYILKLAMTLDPEDAEDVQDVVDNTGDHSTRAF